MIITKNKILSGVVSRKAANGGVLEHLQGKGTDAKLVVDAGLAAESDRGGGLYNRFRDRIMFPIRDARGRAIGFGGRAMDPNARSKYYNSPDTALFDKRRSLYNHGPAREAAGKGKPLIVANGYMDVIALSEAGFTATVAALGTAITEDQLRLLWRIAPEPIIALDGKTTSLRAAMRVIDIALPLLETRQSLRFALMPNEMDPDDVLRTQGKEAMQQLLDQAIPMVELLWQRETEGKVFDSPERKAALDKTLREKIKLIREPSVRRHYGQAIKEMRWKLFKPNHLRRAPAPRKGGDRQPRAKLSARHLDYIVCECSCGKTSELSGEKLEPFLGEDLTAASALSLLSKLRCSECQGPPIQIFDDKKQLLFDAAITQP